MTDPNQVFAPTAPTLPAGAALNGQPAPVFAVAEAQYQQQAAQAAPAAPRYVTVADIDAEKLTVPFRFQLPARYGSADIWQLANPKGMDWQELENLEHGPALALRALMGREQYGRFKEIRGVSAEMINQVIDAWRKHFGMDDPGK